MRRGGDPRTLVFALLRMSGPAEDHLGGTTLDPASREWRGERIECSSYSRVTGRVSA